MTGPLSGEGQRPGFEDENEDENEDELPHLVTMSAIHLTNEIFRTGF